MNKSRGSMYTMIFILSTSLCLHGGSVRLSTQVIIIGRHIVIHITIISMDVTYMREDISRHLTVLVHRLCSTGQSTMIRDLFPCGNGQ